MATDPSPTPDILQQALQWLGLLHAQDMTSTECRQWLAWLDASPQHNQACLQLEELVRRQTAGSPDMV